MKPFAKVEKFKDGSLFFTAGEDDSLDHVSRHGEDIMDVVKFSDELNIAYRAGVREELKEFNKMVQDIVMKTYEGVLSTMNALRLIDIDAFLDGEAKGKSND